MKSLLYKMIAVSLFLTCVGFVFAQAAKTPNPAKSLPPKTPDNFLVDDFKSQESDWEFITDGVMGGMSTGEMELAALDKRRAMHMAGKLSLENNGGFIQVRKNLKTKQGLFNASDYLGVYIVARAKPHKYAIHLRTGNTILPWQYYQADFVATEKWQKIKIPFTKFQPYSLKKKLNTNKIKSIAVVAIKEEFNPNIFIDEIGFYKMENEYNKLTPQEKAVIIGKGTEAPFTGKYYDHYQKGTYTCRQCSAKLYSSSSKFKSGCGWPSFDDEIDGAVKRIPDPDGRRIEIICNNCNGHLGHVFAGEGFTEKDTRHCVNAISLLFVPADDKQAQDVQKSNVKTETAIFASGCFWGTEYHLQQVPGVISTTTGFIGGTVENPSYKQVCTGKTGHAEAVQVVFDNAKTSYKDLATLYFETHDFTQLNRQGPDVGTQYRSEIFYTTDEQKQIAEELIDQLTAKDYEVKTKLTKAPTFYSAENNHQDYYRNNGKSPYCHIYKKVF
jgi:peptide methionine sulfoxide reductase msrA/msrB